MKKNFNFKKKTILFFSLILVLFLMQSLFVFAEDVVEADRIVAVVVEEENPLETGLPEVELYEEEEDGLNEVDTALSDESEAKEDSINKESTLDKILGNPIYLILAIILAIIVLSILWKLAKLAFKIGLFIAIVLFVIWILKQFIF